MQLHDLTCLTLSPVSAAWVLMLLLINILFGSVIKVLLLDDFIKLRLILQHFDFILWLTLILKMWDVCLCIGVCLTQNVISFLFQAGALQTWLWYISRTFHSSFPFHNVLITWGWKLAHLLGPHNVAIKDLEPEIKPRTSEDYCFNRKLQSCFIILDQKST